MDGARERVAVRTHPVGRVDRAATTAAARRHGRQRTTHRTRRPEEACPVPVRRRRPRPTRPRTTTTAAETSEPTVAVAVDVELAVVVASVLACRVTHAHAHVPHPPVLDHPRTTGAWVSVVASRLHPRPKTAVTTTACVCFAASACVLLSTVRLTRVCMPHHATAPPVARQPTHSAVTVRVVVVA